MNDMLTDIEKLLTTLKTYNITVPPLTASTMARRNNPCHFSPCSHECAGRCIKKLLTPKCRDQIFSLGIDATPWISFWSKLLVALRDNGVYEREIGQVTPCAVAIHAHYESIFTFERFKEDWKILSNLDNKKMEDLIYCLEKSNYVVFSRLAAKIKEVIANDI